MLKIKKYSLFIFAVLGMLTASQGGHAQNLRVQSYNNNASSTQVMPVLGGGAARQQQAIPAYPPNQQAAAAGYQDKPHQGTAEEEEYRGYNGRTIEQAFYRCKYESFRAAPPGAKATGLTERFRIRMSVMDVCMNSEGFFRTKNSFGGLDTNLMTVRDIF
jgi:hypothetical protein